MLVRSLSHSVLICATLLCVYSAAFGLGFVFDDETLIIGGKHLFGLSDVIRNAFEPYLPGLPYFRPLSKFTLDVQRFAFEGVPFWYHVFNAALVCGLGWVLFFWCRSQGVQPKWSAAAAIIVCVHPVVSSAVYPITGREALLASGLIGLIFCFEHRCGLVWAMLRAALVVLALASRESAIAVIPAVMVFRICAAGPMKGALQRWLADWGLALGAATLFMILRSMMLASESSFILADSPLLFPWSLGYAVQTLFVPSLGLRYQPSLEYALDWRLGAAILVIAVTIWRLRVNKSLSFSGFLPEWLSTTLVALVLFLPTANILWQETFFDERHLIVCLVPLSLLVARLMQEQIWARWILCLMVFPVAVFITRSRAVAFLNDEKFNQVWLQYHPQSPFALQQEGLRLYSLGELLPAKALLQRSKQALETDLINLDLARVQIELEDYQSAEESCQQAKTLLPQNNDSETCLAEIAWRMKRHPEAAAIAETLLPDDLYTELILALVKASSSPAPAVLLESTDNELTYLQDLESRGVITSPSAARLRLLTDLRNKLRDSYSPNAAIQKH